jgi:sulfite exporter TauE/SafE
MPEPPYLALLLIGLLGWYALHRHVRRHRRRAVDGRPDAHRLHLAYNLGRVVSYATAGAIAGALGQAGVALSGQCRCAAPCTCSPT